MTEYLALWSVLWKEVPGGDKILATGLALIATGLALVAAGGAGLIAAAAVNAMQERSLR